MESLRKMKILPNHNYHFLEELEISKLQEYGDHRRLSLYLKKGTKCHGCGIDCNRLIKAKSCDGSIHVDLYDSELKVMLTVGHIIPKSKGGKMTDDNIRPLCHICNHKEGFTINHVAENEQWFNTLIKDKPVKRKSKNVFQNGETVAIIKDKFVSENDGLLYFVFVGGFTYDANKCIFL